MLNTVRARYKHIVIDTPPVLPAAEAMVLAEGPTPPWFCVMARTSVASNQVRRTCERLAASVHAVGVVLNGVPRQEYLYCYGNYYGYATKGQRVKNESPDHGQDGSEQGSGAGKHAKPTRRFNMPLLLGALLALVVLAPAAHFWHEYQVLRLAGVFLRRADSLEAEQDLTTGCGPTFQSSFDSIRAQSACGSMAELYDRSATTWAGNGSP